MVYVDDMDTYNLLCIQQHPTLRRQSSMHVV